MIRPFLPLIALGALSACLALPSGGKTGEVSYLCADGARLRLEPGVGQVVLDGKETLLAEEGKPQRYSWPSDGTHHIWQIQDGIGTLLLHDGTTGTERLVHADCRAQPG